MHVKRQLKVATCGRLNTKLQVYNRYNVENENFTLEKCSNVDKMMQVTNFVSHVLNKGTQWKLPYITVRTDTKKIQIQQTYNDVRTALLDTKNLNRVILPTTVSATGFMHNTKIDSLNNVNLSIQERTYVPTYMHTYTYINTYAATCLTLQGYTLKCKNKTLSNMDDLFMI
jgi:hypothetical protein